MNILIPYFTWLVIWLLRICWPSNILSEWQNNHCSAHFIYSVIFTTQLLKPSRFTTFRYKLVQEPWETLSLLNRQHQGNNLSDMCFMPASLVSALNQIEDPEDFRKIFTWVLQCRWWPSQQRGSWGRCSSPAGRRRRGPWPSRACRGRPPSGRRSQTRRGAWSAPSSGHPPDFWVFIGTTLVYNVTQMHVIQASECGKQLQKQL